MKYKCKNGINQDQRTSLKSNMTSAYLYQSPGFLGVEFGFKGSSRLELGFGELGQCKSSLSAHPHPW